MENEGMPPEGRLDSNRRIFRKALAFFFVVLLVVASYLLGVSRGKWLVDSEYGTNAVPLDKSIIDNKDSGRSNVVDFSLFWRVWDLVKQKHIDRDKFDAQQMVYGAISGMLRATGDPYTSFFDPKENKAFSEDLGGSFEGIGAELGMKDGLLTIIAPLDGSPAEGAGLKAGDKILKVDDKVISDMSIDDAVNLIRGKKGTQVRLTIIPNGQQDAKEVTVTRDKIEVKSVKLEMKEGGIAYFRITKFSENTATEFDSAMDSALSQGAKAIILDLRNNPGGLVDRCVSIASRLIPKGETVVMEEDSSGKRQSIATTGGDKLSGLPAVVLINEGSASASEILAGALRDDMGDALVGKKSFGKGSVQELDDLPGGASVKITIAKWLTPNGDYIMEKGIDPDAEVDLSQDDYDNGRDPQLDKAMELIRGKL